MKPVHHVMISTGVTAVFWWWTRSLPGSVVCFLSGIFIDLDHHIDYMLVKKKIPWNYREFEKYFSQHQYWGKPLYLFFHAYEWLILLWGSIFLYQLGPIWMGLAIGLTTHLIADQFYNQIKSFGYFFTYRCFHRFESQRILKPLTTHK